MGGEVLRKVWDELGDHPEGLGWVEGPSQRARTCFRTTLRSGTGRGTLLEV